MPVAPSQKAREGAAFAQSKLPPGLGLEAKTIRIISGPVSLRTFAFWGVVIFIVGFLHGRQMSNLAIGTGESVTGESAPPAQTAATAPAPAQTPEPPAGITRVTIQLFKFSPGTIEVKTGQTVEWANDDLTPHTVTSQGAGNLNSGTIDAGSSWRRTFTEAGTFPYFCTFHPEMKGKVIVK